MSKQTLLNLFALIYLIPLSSHFNVESISTGRHSFSFVVAANIISYPHHSTNRDNTEKGTCGLDSSHAEEIIQTFLCSKKTGGEKFYIQGWRWHTLSLIRDSDRLKKYATSIQKDMQNTSREKIQSLNKAVDHVVDFNLKGLQRIEDDVFFPWLRKKLINEDTVGADAKNAFEEVINGVDCDRKKIAEIASKIRSEMKILADPANPSLRLENSMNRVVELSNSLSSVLSSIMAREDRLLVPAVTKVVTAREQKTFNNKVLRNLGIFESRCHLVGMHDAVYDSAYGSKEEQSLFVEQIPSVARIMIERWRRSLYEPKAGML